MFVLGLLQVFSDYCQFLGDNSAVTYLPSSTFWYGMVPGQQASFSLPRNIAIENGFETLAEQSDADVIDISLTLDRIEGIKHKDQRNIHFIVASGDNKHHFQLALTDEVQGRWRPMLTSQGARVFEFWYYYCYGPQVLLPTWSWQTPRTPLKSPLLLAAKLSKFSRPEHQLPKVTLSPSSLL